MSKRDILKFDGCALGMEKCSCESGGLRLGDLSFVETHDCFTIAELIEYEAMGLTAGRTRRAPDAGGLDPKGRKITGEPFGWTEG